tara:strand:+ start:2195 stop:2815 length:621 start_codon:yes stop_codon:yes gene_type:complete
MTGQINRGSKLGDIIYKMCNQDDIKTIVEIGTWNGMGSTKCIYDSIIENNKKDYLVYSLESNQEFHNLAINNLPPLVNFNLVLGKILEACDTINLDLYNDIFFQECSRDLQKSWLIKDIDNYNKVKNVIDIIPRVVDLLILDGGEFSSLAEFNKLKDRTTYFILDDINTIKNFEIANIMRNSNNYQILFDCKNDRNGFLISKQLFK